jgi:hypothetical protein
MAEQLMAVRQQLVQLVGVVAHHFQFAYCFLSATPRACIQYLVARLRDIFNNMHASFVEIRHNVD